MSFKWKEFVEFARYASSVKGPGFGEDTALRVGVSRAYFGAFGETLLFAEQKGYYSPSKDYEDHFGLVKALNERARTGGERRCRLLASWLGELRKWRNSCDYDQEVVNLNKVYESALRRCEEVFSRLES